MIDKKLGELGKIVTVYDLPNQPVASLNIEGKEVLFPLMKQFIVTVDREAGILHVDLPDGLLDVYK